MYKCRCWVCTHIAGKELLSQKKYKEAAIQFTKAIKKNALNPRVSIDTTTGCESKDILFFGERYVSSYSFLSFGIHFLCPFMIGHPEF